MKSRKDTLREMVSANPDDVFSRYGLALELEKEGSVGEAIAELREALKRDLGFVAAYYQLGRILAKAGDEEEAGDVYRRGLEAARAAGDQKTALEFEAAIGELE